MDYFLNLDNLEQTLKISVSYKISTIMSKYFNMKVTKKDFINSICALDIVKASQEHIRFVTFQLYKQKLMTDPDLTSPTTKQTLTDMCLLYGLNYLNTDFHSCYESGHFNSAKPYDSFILEAIKVLLLRIRP